MNLNNNYLNTIRHSAAHVMAAAIYELYSNVMFDIGTSINNGYYYDFDMQHRLTPDDFEKIENKMCDIIKSDIPFERIIISREEACDFFKNRKQRYKLERLSNINDCEEITLYKLGNFIDLCKGPHVDSSGQIGEIKLLSVAGSYFKGDENNNMLQRVYGTAFKNKEELNKYIQDLEYKKSIDHRQLGKKLDLFSISQNIGSGLILWHPRGAMVKNNIESFWRDEHYKNNYELVNTPHIGNSNLWSTSGHLSYYKDNMYPSMKFDTDLECYIKPMNCPFHIEIYKSKIRSYKDLPVRFAELGTVYRNERSGVLHGLFRVRGFTQDDAHIICSKDQMNNEIVNVINFTISMLNTFGFNNIIAYVATKPKNSIGNLEDWNFTTDVLKKSLEISNINYELDTDGGIFYGPKIDLKFCDSINREWQLSTIQVDFNLPEKFNMYYVNSDGKRCRPYMLHRALLGSIERFIGLLLEHYNGNLPLWLAPEQIRILPINEMYNAACNNLKNSLININARVKIDDRKKNIESKIKDAFTLKIPYIIIFGKNELENNLVSVRSSKYNKDTMIFKIDEFIQKITKEINEKHN